MQKFVCQYDSLNLLVINVKINSIKIQRYPSNSLMYDQQRQSKSIECLTKYLQYFKTYFSLSFSLIQCHAFPAKFTSAQLETITQKIIQKKFDIAFEQSPFNLLISENAKSYIDRFYMRILEFLEYRLNIFKASDVDKKLQPIINSFIGNLHKFFKLITSKNFSFEKEKILIGQLIFQIEGMVRKLFHLIFDHLEKINEKNSINFQEITFSRKLINEEILINFSNKLQQLQKQSDILHYNINEDSFSNEIYQNDKIIRKVRPKSQFRVDSLYSFRTKLLRENQIKDPSNLFSIRRLYPTSVQLQGPKTQNLTKKSLYAQNLAIMDIENIEVYSREYIMQELQRKNAINKQMIKKYLQVIKKKSKKQKCKALFSHQPQPQIKKDLSNKKINVLNFEVKAKSYINVNMLPDKTTSVHQASVIKEGYISQQNKELLETNKVQNSSVETVLIQKFSKPLTQGNLSKALQIMEEKQQYKSKSQSFRSQFIKKTTVNQNPEFQTNRQTFAYKEKQKLYFQSLKNKMTLQNQKITKKLQSMKSESQKTARKIDKISIPSITETPPPNEYRKMFRNNLKKSALKGSSFLSNKAEDRIKGSNSDLFSKNELTSISIDTNLVSLQGSKLCKRIPKRGKLVKFLQNLDLIKSSSVEEMPQENPRDIQNLSYIQAQSSVLVLPRIQSNKKQLNRQK